MAKNLSTLIYIIVMIAVIVAVDLLFFRQKFWERLVVNIIIALVFIALYFRFLSR